MARSFYRPKPENTIEDYAKKNTFYHKASASYFTMFARDGKYFQRRYQIGFDGRQTNLMEKEVHFIMGSGNHVRTYLHRTSRNTLIELPLACYFAMLTRRVLVTAIRVSRPEYAGTALHAVPLATDHSQEPVTQ